MDTAVTIVLSHNDTSKWQWEVERGHTDTNTVTDRSSLKEKTDKLRTLKHTVAAAYVYCSRAKGCDAMMAMGGACV